MKPFKNPIYVTRPYLPKFGEYVTGLKEIWENQWLTNNGPVLDKFNNALSAYFNTENICLFNNGTLALQIALQGMGITGEVITTPFTFVATAHALIWNKIRPVFVDIEPDYYTIDPEKIEAAITPWTTAILAVHVYGYPCNLEKLADIARRHNLKLIYDAAHAFGVIINGKSIGSFGDLSMFSFHSTKLFHSIEGGMLTFPETYWKSTFDYLKNFGFKNELEVVMVGTNAKMNEMQALMGVLILDKIDEIIEYRKKITDMYQKHLYDIPGIRYVKTLPSNIKGNYAYFPIEIDEVEYGISRDSLYDRLKEYNVYTRRYFYPLVCDYACYQNIPIQDPLTVARKVATRILALPIYSSLKLEDVEKICSIIKLLKK